MLSATARPYTSLVVIMLVMQLVMLAASYRRNVSCLQCRLSMLVMQVLVLVMFTSPLAGDAWGCWPFPIRGPATLLPFSGPNPCSCAALLSRHAVLSVEVHSVHLRSSDFQQTSQIRILPKPVLN